MRNRVVILALIVGSCLAGYIIEAPKKNNSSDLIGATIKILKSCYGNQVDDISLTGRLDDIFMKSLLEQLIPVTLINPKRPNDRRGYRKSQRKFQVLVIAASSSTKFTDILKGVKDSVWWNHLASFIILSESEHQCSNAYGMLWAAWKLDLLKAKLLCLHRTNGPMIYGFNPFTKKAPYPWELKKTYSGKNDHPWALFARRFQEDERTCEELDFDKTNDLGGYEVRSINASNIITDALGGLELRNLAKLLYQTLNATYKLIDPNTTDYAVLNRLVSNGFCDTMFLPRYQSTTVNFTTSYPFWQSGLSVVTQYSGEVSQLGKLKSVLDRTSRCGVCLIFLITLIFFKFILRQSLMSGILNNLRVAVSVSVLNVPQNHTPRIYLASLFLFALTIQGIYQGQLASLLTKPLSLPNVNTMEDLTNSHHAIYGYESLAGFFNEPPLKGRFVALTGMNTVSQCLEIVRRNSSVSCVRDRFHVIDKVVEMNLHLSSQTIIKDYWVYIMRPDWPLEHRVNINLQRLVEADLVRYWLKKWTQRSEDKCKFYSKQENNQHFKVLTLKELSFAFVILGIGLAIATVIFFVEFFNSLARLRFTNALVDIRNRCGMKNN